MLRLVLLALPVAWTTAAHAALGGDAATVMADAAQLHASVQPSTGAGPGMVSITADNGVSVHEFLDSGGLVYAVNWSGPAVPDLRGLLGDYFATYAALLAALPNPGRQRAIQVATADLVVRTSGHLRAYSGLAYLPARIPTGVALATLR